MIASIYHYVNDSTFKIEDETLGYSVMSYAMTAILAMTLLTLRRKLAFFGQAELGGPSGPKYFSGIILLFLWFSYILLSSLQAYDHIKVPY